MQIIVLAIGIVVVLGGGVGWLACGGWKSVGIRFEDDATSPVAISEIRVSGKSVAVELRPGTGQGVRIHRTARYLNPFHDRPPVTHRIEGSVLQLGGDDSCSLCVIEYAVIAPAGIRVTADVGTGSLDLASVSTVDVKVSTGSVTVADATGNVTMRADTGSITGLGLRSEAVVATAQTGAISLDMATAADIEATTGTGSVDVTVPAGSYRVDATTGLGAVKQGIPSDPGAAHRLLLRSGTGRVTLAPR